MIWSAAKIILFFCALALVVLGATYLLDTGGRVHVAFGGMEFNPSPLVAIIGLFLFVVAIWLALALLRLLVAVFRFFNGDETAISRYFSRNRERKGYEALTDGLVALAAGDGKIAAAKAAKAEKLLERPELTHLIRAQAAELSGDKLVALKYYKSLLANDKTRFVGIQGLLKQKLDEGDTDRALLLAEKAFALQPRHDQTLNTLFSLQSDKEDWSGARKTVEAKVRASVLPKEVGRRREAVLSLADARLKFDEGDIPAAKAATLHANKLAPNLVPAAVLASEVYSSESKKRPAANVLKKAWSANPHPDLAAAFAEIEPEETPLQRNKRFQALLKLQPANPETIMLKAELLLAAEEFPAARRAISDVVETSPTARSLTIMAAVSKGEGAEEHVVRGWLAKALAASRGPQWICSSCNRIHGNWSPKCDNCSNFDTFDWKAPAESENAQETVSLLPSVAGMLTDKITEDDGTGEGNEASAKSEADEAEVVEDAGAAKMV